VTRCNKDTATKNTVAYSGVLFTMELYCTPKFNTQLLITISSTPNTPGATSLSDPRTHLTTVKHSQQFFEHTYTSNLYVLRTLTQSSNQKESVAKHTRTSTRGDFQNMDCSTNQSNPVDNESHHHRNVRTPQQCHLPTVPTIHLNCCEMPDVHCRVCNSALLRDRALMSRRQGNLTCNNTFPTTFPKF
jgi:hypothetical protein